MKILSLILSTTMLINSIPCTSLYADLKPNQVDDVLSDSQRTTYTVPAAPYEGTDDFKEIIQKGGFVDKTLFIKAIIEDNHKAVLITRPRRWGKSINFSMFRYFFMPEIASDGLETDPNIKGNPSLFKTLKVSTGGFLDTRELLNRLLLENILTLDLNIGQHKDTIQEIAANSHVEFQLKGKILNKFDTIRGQEVTQVTDFVKSYSSELKNKFSGMSNLPHDLVQLAQLGSQIKANGGEEQQRKAQAAYNAKFEEVRQQIEGYIKSDPTLKSELSKEFDLMSRHQGQYPTILLSLKEVKEATYQSFENQLRLRVNQLFRSYPYVYDSLFSRQSNSNLKASEKQNAESDFSKLKRLYSDEAKASTVEDLKDSLRFLSELLHNYHGKRAYILIDEYDTPLHEAYIQGYSDQAFNFMRGFFGSALKGNLSLEKGILTGILRIAKANLFSGLNNFIEDSVLSTQYSPYYGFTDKEVTGLLNTYQVLDKDAVMQWYNGYSIGGITIYNPWSIMNYLDAVSKKKPNLLIPYWVDTGDTRLIEKSILDPKVQETLDLLYNGTTVMKGIQRDITVFDIGRSQDSLWPLLLYSGYLTTKSIVFDENVNNYFCELRIPNKEVRSLFGGFLLKRIETKLADLSNIQQTAQFKEEFQRAFQGLIAFFQEYPSFQKQNTIQEQFKLLESTIKHFHLEASLLDRLYALRDHQATTAIFDAIVSSSITSLQKALSGEEKVRCESSLFNFNFLHLAALSGNKDVFSAIEKYCGTSLLTSKDKQGLTPIDYAYLSSNQNAVFFFLKERKKEANLIYSPGFGSKFFCYAAIPTIGGVIPQLAATSVRIYSGVTAPTAVKALVKAPNLAVMALGIGTGTYFKDSALSYLDFDVCKNYKNYNDINAKSPRQFSSLKQFEKYMADHKNAYLALNTNCTLGRHKNVTTIKLQPFTYDEKSFSVTLCDLPENITEEL